MFILLLLVSLVSGQQQQQQQQGHNYIIASTHTGTDFMALFGSVVLIGLLTAGILSVIGMGVFKFLKLKKGKKSHRNGHVCHLPSPLPLKPLVPLFPIDINPHRDVVHDVQVVTLELIQKFGKLQTELSDVKFTHDQKLQDLKKECDKIIENLKKEDDQIINNLKKECSHEFEKNKILGQFYEKVKAILDGFKPIPKVDEKAQLPEQLPENFQIQFNMSEIYSGMLESINAELANVLKSKTG